MAVQYNMSLPEKERLHMFGLDVEFQQDMTIKALQMLDTKAKPDNLEEGTLKKAVQAVRDGSSQWYELLQKAAQEEQEETKAYYGENWKWAERILKNQEITLQFVKEGGDAESQVRDDNMADNFWFVYDQFPKKSFSDSLDPIMYTWSIRLPLMTWSRGISLLDPFLTRKVLLWRERYAAFSFIMFQIPPNG